ncbi:MAG TPA: hypothetical protein VFH47_06995 [Candidatus Thermoplasmatota archaeon]|nr:hypothetical protein [Candidatus Thermoplasmatota archaeon]
MRLAAIAAMLACLAFAAAASAGPLPSPLFAGPYAGVASDGSSHAHEYSTHPPHTLCAAVYIPHQFVVTLDAAPTDTLVLRVGSHAATTFQGAATLTFIANYCTAFTIHVEGVEVLAGPYAVTVSHVNSVGGAVCCLDAAMA